MKGKTSVMLLVAIALGVGTAKVGWDLVQKNSPKAESTEYAKVLIAKHDMDPGSVLEAEDLEPARVPAVTAPKNALKDVKDAVGRTVVASVAANQVLFEGLLAPADSPGGLQALVPEGMRAVTVEVNESSGVAGLLIPGARVDVISTLHRGEETIARTIVENVKVTAVGRRLVRGEKEETGSAVRTVTLVMSPKNAEAIELASTNGRPRLVLRGSQDHTPTASPGVSLEELVGAGHTATIGASNLPLGNDAFASAEGGDAATTRPAESFQNSFVRRPVQIIRGGSESVIYYEVPVIPARPGGSVAADNPPVSAAP